MGQRIFCKARELSNAKGLTNREKSIDRLARIARNDAVHGGAKAMVIINTLRDRPDKPCEGVVAFDNIDELDDAVSAAYHSGTGTASEYLAHECGECGCVLLGKSAALRCCTEQEDDDSSDAAFDEDDE